MACISESVAPPRYRRALVAYQRSVCGGQCQLFVRFIDDHIALTGNHRQVRPSRQRRCAGRWRRYRLEKKRDKPAVLLTCSLTLTVLDLDVDAVLVPLALHETSASASTKPRQTHRCERLPLEVALDRIRAKRLPSHPLFGRHAGGGAVQYGGRRGSEGKKDKERALDEDLVSMVEARFCQQVEVVLAN